MSKRFLAATGILKVYLPGDVERPSLRKVEDGPTYSLTLPREQAQDIIDGLAQQERFKHALFVFEQQEIMGPRSSVSGLTPEDYGC